MQQEFNPRLYLNELQEMTAVARLHYEIWWVYMGPDHNELYAKIRNRYSHFFFASEKAHTTTLITELYRLYETRPDTYNVPTYLDLMEQAGKYEQEQLTNFRDQCQQLKPLWIKVSILRNQIYSHKNANKKVEDIFREASVTPNNLRDLVEATKKLINDMAYQLDRSYHAFNLSATADTVFMLEKLLKKEDSKK